jgi:hypothetical protein
MASRKSGRGKSRANTGGAKKKPQVIKEPIEQPTPEQSARVTFDLITITDEMGKALGRGYRRRPLFETMRTTGAISPDEVDALRFYRTAHDRCEYSPMKSCLNVENGGGGFSAAQAAFVTTPSVLAARRNLRLCEARLGHSLATMRAVALDDRSFSELAVQRYGCREKDGKILPKSGRDRARIKDEFQAGLLTLTDIVRSLTTQAGVEEIWVFPEDDGTATIRRGIVAPARTYRCWGDSEKLDTIMADLRKRWGGQLRFATPQAARDALDEADAGRLGRLLPDELAA